MLTVEIIRRKRDGKVLAKDDIRSFINGLCSGTVADSQAAAFAMAICLQGMSRDETVALTLAMADSGRRLNFAGLGGPVLDKHSTGGIGDKVSLILAPILAAAGAYVPMISGRGLGHTGGTLDKLDSIVGYSTTVDMDRFKEVVRAAGCAIVGQSADLAPADRRLYAIRDVTATVDSIPLIVASILSKKLAAGLGGLVMDVKVGSGAFMTTLADAQTLAQELTAVAEGAGLACRACLTDMNQCLGDSAGNAVEVREALAMLLGHKGDSRLRAVTLHLATELLVLGDLAASRDEAQRRVITVLESGAAAERFQRMVAALGGPKDLIERPEHHLERAPIIRPAILGRRGYVKAIDGTALGLALIELGGGRRMPGEPIDHRVGLTAVKGLGDEIGPDQPFAFVHAAEENRLQRAIMRIRSAVEVGEEPLQPPPVVYSGQAIG